MSRVYINLGLESASSSFIKDYEKDYQEIYKNAATFFYSHSSFPFFFAFSGREILYYHKKHPEFLKIMHELENRKQTEILGGGYYNPVFPLLYPTDRTGQIEMLSAQIRSLIGKRPRGMTLCAESWDLSLVTNFQTSGMEYVLLDSAVVPPAKQYYLPLSMAERMKSIDIVPVYNSLKISSLNFIEITESANDEEKIKNLAEQFLKEIQKKASRPGTPEGISDSWKCVTFLFSHDEFKILFDSGFLSALYEIAATLSDISFSLPTATRKMLSKIPCYIPSGLGTDVAKWGCEPYGTAEKNLPNNIFDFLETYPSVKSIYDRMLYTSLLINSFHGDKIRKNTAREKLWEAQAGETFICSKDGVFASQHLRQNCFKKLIEAEQILRDTNGFEESVTAFDFNGDSVSEYILRMNQYFSYISMRDGCILELDVISNAKNYCNNLSRISKFDGINDGYKRGLFVDKLFTKENFGNYIAEKNTENCNCSLVRYDELKFSSQKKEIQLIAQSKINSHKENAEIKQNVIVHKKYIANSDGFSVQYILKNESNEKLSCLLVVEQNFSEFDYTENGKSCYSVQAVSAGEKKEFKELPEILGTDVVHDVSAVQLTDKQDGISFMFEPNENCDIAFSQIAFKRQAEKNEVMVAGATFVANFFWNVELEPNHDTEKTINFAILNQSKENKKRAKKKSE